jgi:hypothetical protein
VYEDDDLQVIHDLLDESATGEHKVYLVGEIRLDNELISGMADINGDCILMGSTAGQKALIHELGHNLGLNHTPETPGYWNYIMFKYDYDNNRFLRYDDKIGFETPCNP